MDNLIELKKSYLLDDRGMIRPGIISMTNYAKILSAQSEDELESIIDEIMSSNEGTEINNLNEEEE